MKSGDDQYCSGKRTDEEPVGDKLLTPRDNASLSRLNHEHAASLPAASQISSIR